LSGSIYKDTLEFLGFIALIFIYLTLLCWRAIFVPTYQQLPRKLAETDPEVLLTGILKSSFENARRMDECVSTLPGPLTKLEILDMFL